MRHNHTNKAFPAEKILPRHVTWVTPNPNYGWPAYGDHLMRRVYTGGSRFFEERLGARGQGTRQALKQIHRKKSRQYTKRLVASELVCDAE